MIRKSGAYDIEASDASWACVSNTDGVYPSIGGKVSPEMLSEVALRCC